jgi:hypothetical protein
LLIIALSISFLLFSALVLLVNQFFSRFSFTWIFSQWNRSMTCPFLISNKIFSSYRITVLVIQASKVFCIKWLYAKQNRSKNDVKYCIITVQKNLTRVQKWSN